MAHVGRRNQIGITIDTDAIIEHQIPFLDCTLQERHTPIGDIQAKGRRDAEGGQSVVGKQWGDGKIDVVLDPTTAPYWFAMALGAIDSTTPKTHVITQEVLNAPLTAIIKRARNVGTDLKFLNSVVDSLELNFADDVAKLSVNLMSKFPTTDTFSPAEETALKYFTFRNATVATGAGTIKVKELTLRIENNAEMIYAPGSNDVDRILWKSFKVSGNFKLLFETETQKDAFANTLTKQSMTITFTGAAPVSSIVITIPQFRVDNWTEEASIDDLAQEGIDFVAEYLTDKTIGVTVINSVDEYQTPES